MWLPGPTADLKVSLIQTAIEWARPEKNRSLFKHLIAPLKGKTDLILLPEMFTSGFAMEPEIIQSGKDYETTRNWMIDMARSTGAVLCGTLVCPFEDDKRLNRLLFATPDGELWHYDKTHLFRMAGEHERYQQGKRRKIFTYRGWRILPTICYDLRFPVFLRNQGDYDLMLCPANWPAARRLPWRTLLQARAIENLAYVAGVNRIGRDGKGFDYSGDSMVIDFKGQYLIDEPENQPFVKTATLNASQLGSFREKFPAWQDADSFQLTNLDNSD